MTSVLSVLNVTFTQLINGCRSLYFKIFSYHNLREERRASHC